MHTRSIARLGSMLRARELSAVELATHYLDRIERLNGRLNAFITVDRDKTLAHAREADARIGRGEAGPLTGIPIAHKDLFCARGWLTTCGSRMLGNFVAPYDAHVIEQFDRAGAVILGKTNMDEFAMGSSNENSYFGPVLNPWDERAVPGGSSGGSAAAVAALLAPGATGTDTGGSIRQPASFTGTSGLRATYGRVSRHGMVAFASSLDQAGVIARSAEDLALLFAAMAGFDARDSTCVDHPKDDYVAGLGRGVKGLRIGMPREYFTADLASDVAAPILAAIDEYKRLGASVVEVSLPNQHLSVPVYYVLAPAEASSNLSRYDGVRYGYRAPEFSDLNDMYAKTRAQGFGAEVKRRIMIGAYVLSHGYYDAYYLQAQRLRRLIADDFERAFRECDVIMGPAAPSVAFDIGARTKDPVQMYLDDLYTIPINLSGLPGMSIPCGFGDRGRPVGLQIVGNHFDEARMLAVAHAFQQATDFHTKTAPGFV
ncbi:MAG TPA: Asp-tRNA(Asn)/Glu-tRNA(Gln) amidotransferase subunit GatA [Usitatibacter sp.]|nr:Asp-tRNA(Asn)/Glu-tRNA(Gln) amidotransferase subunit GatA [Usitatibacter sp.]